MKLNYRLILIGFSILNLLQNNAYTQGKTKPDDNRFTKVVLAQKLEEPMQFQIMNDGKVLYAERKGKLKLYDPATNKMTIIADLFVSREYVSKTGDRSEGEDGLQGVILDPDYNKTHWIYIYYSPKNESVNRLSRFTWTGGKLNMTTEKKIIDVEVQREECCHVGGGMLFDKDKNLLLSTGDNTFSRSSDGFTPIDERPGESPKDAQKSSGNTNDLRGKILRIHPEPDGTYTIPDGNLFPKGTPKTRPEIYTMGNRNPWRLTIDSKTNWLYWGEVGPDGSNSSESRGPRSYDEFNIAKKAGNYGWPYFIGNNQAYRYYNFATKQSGALYDAMNPVNSSPNNTGLNRLTPAVASMIWYPYAASEEFPEMGSGGRSAVGGPIFHKSDFKQTAKVFPHYFEGKWLITDWVRGWLLLVTLDDNGNFKSMERFLPNLTLRGPIDIKFGPDGSLYVLEYGNGYFKDNPEAELIKIEYNGGNRKPVVQVSTTVSAGLIPLKIKLSSSGTADADGDSLKYEWKITKGGILKQSSKLPDPEITLTASGVYKATLTVTDNQGAKNSKSVDIAAGNAIPIVRLNFTKGNSSFYFPGTSIKYAVNVTDKEDGSLTNKRISPAQVSVSINYLTEGYDMTVIAQRQNNFDVTAQFSTAKAMIKKSDCNACHAVDTKSLGPSFKQVALKYKGNKTAEGTLVKKVINGGAGVWGDAMMPAHSTMPVTEVSSIVKYILSLSEKAPVNRNLPVNGTYTTNVKPGQTNKGSFIFRAAYKDRGTKLAPAQFAEHVVVLKDPYVLVSQLDGFNEVDFNKNKTAVISKVSGASILMKNVDLTDLKKMEFITDGKGIDGDVEVHIDSVDGRLIGKASASNSVVALVPITGKHSLWFVFLEKGTKLSAIKMNIY
ncbi:PQQ-dependent sugar dehydrogenase [Pedobacter frigoris]|uniref:PKD domain-containing protein n=1 Tax=Pedobacter frigoris TaxID=2571272 RepID=A0A4U1CUB0_9SPHI|nr:PQQ-dependent sugar dehydrogenase [Pedobacter frigoris]TKC09589.1 PKD domain-containing protein [Pedobacter frigoris]